MLATALHAVQELGCAAGAGQLAALRALPAAALVAKSFAATAHDCYEPAIDRRDTELCVKPWSSPEALRDGRFHKVPVMLGVTDHDGLGKMELEQVLFRDAKTRQELDVLLQEEFGPSAGRVISRYWPSEVPEAKAVHQSLSRLSNDLWYFSGTHSMAQLLAQQTAVFSYSFGGLKHSAHGSDAMYWRGLPKGSLPAMMSTYLANFARSGDPNDPSGAGAGSLPVWEQGHQRRLHLGNPTEMQDMALEDQDWHQFLATEYFSKVLLEKVRSELGECRGAKRAKIVKQSSAVSTDWPRLLIVCNLLKIPPNIRGY